MVSNFFTDSGTFYRPEWKSALTTNVITMKPYKIIILRRINILQKISRPEILRTLIEGPEWRLGFCSVKLSEIIFCNLHFVLWKVIIKYNFDEKLKLTGWKDQKF